MPEARADRTLRERVEESTAVSRRLLEPAQAEALIGLSLALVTAYRSGGKLLLFGNGGSAADAQHIAAEFVGRLRLERRSLPAIALADSSATLSAIGNDYGFGAVFSRQVQGLGAPGDVAIGLSTSGVSENVVEGLRAARSEGLVTAALTGRTGAPAARQADHWLAVEATDAARVQEATMLAAHVMCEVVEHELFGRHA